MDAICVLRNDKASFGTIKFSQSKEGSPTTITVDINNNELTEGRHGFHVHHFGDNTNGCISAGPHFNPFGKTHGGPDSAVRHVGDLGNVTVDASGKCSTVITDPQVSLLGENSVIGRTMVLHAGVDDLGLGGNEESLKTGNAGGRVACGIIGFCCAPAKDAVCSNKTNN